MTFIFLYEGSLESMEHVNRRGCRFLVKESYLDVSEYINISTDDSIHNISVIQEIFYIRKIINGPSMSKKLEDELCETLAAPFHLKERCLSENLDIFAVPFTLFSDDTSANKSKKWKKVDVVYLRLSSKIFSQFFSF